jgi:hypothetical protein
VTAPPPIFVDCPYGGRKDGYCACLEQDVDDELREELEAYSEELADYPPSRSVETVLISIDDYEPPQGT